jgi:hypothetical protein
VGAAQKGGGGGQLRRVDIGRGAEVRGWVSMSVVGWVKGGQRSRVGSGTREGWWWVERVGKGRVAAGRLGRGEVVCEGGGEGSDYGRCGSWGREELRAVRLTREGRSPRLHGRSGSPNPPSPPLHPFCSAPSSPGCLFPRLAFCHPFVICCAWPSGCVEVGGISLVVCIRLGVCVYVRARALAPATAWRGCACACPWRGPVARVIACGWRRPVCLCECVCVLVACGQCTVRGGNGSQ